MDFLTKMALKPQYSKPNSILLDVEIDEGYLRDIVAELSFERVYRTPPNVKARDIIVREFVKMERQPMLGDPPFDNIILGNPNHATKLIGAHYIERDVLEAIQPDYNPKMEGVSGGSFKVTIEWIGND